MVFVAPGEVEVREETMEAPKADEVFVRTLCSAVSPGTERLVYRGNLPDDLALDASIEVLRGQSSRYPLTYGYASVGVVEATGSSVSSSWEGTRVFAFQPHVSRFVAAPSALVPLPQDVDVSDAVMIPSVETAINLVMDGRPMIGEKAVVFGQGVVGLLTTALLNRHPLERLLTSDLSTMRRRRSVELGADTSFDPGTIDALCEQLGVEPGKVPEATETYAGADLAYELTGDPSVLNDAIRCTGFRGRIVVGSWYGTKSSPVELGRRFHRSRMQIISSQVSTIDPSYRGRWTKGRRMSTVLEVLDELNPGQLITERFSIDEAPRAYEQLRSDDELLQPVFEYA